MKILLKTCCLVAAAALLGLTSCLDNGKEVFYRDFFGVVQRNDNGSWYFMADDSTTFWPANGPALASDIPQDARRALASMQFDSDLKLHEGYHHTVNMTNLLFIPTLPVTATDQDSIDNAPGDTLLSVAGMLSLQYLTLEAVYRTYDSDDHTFALLRDSAQTGSPVELLLSHHNYSTPGSSRPEKTFGTYLAFDLETLAERATQDSVRLRFVPPTAALQGEPLEFTYYFKK